MIHIHLKKIGRTLKQSFTEWSSDHAMTFSAALSYYMIFSIAPLLLISIAVAGLILGQETSQNEMLGTVRDLLGPEGAKTIQSFMKEARVQEHGIIATVIGVFTLLIGATTVFTQLQEALNRIWKVEEKKISGVWHMIKSRIVSLSLILVIGLLLLVSLIISAILSAVNEMAITHLPGGEILWQLINTGMSFAIATFLFAAIFKILPDVKLSWKDVGMGGAITALFFSAGKTLIGLYIGHQATTSTYGAAGSAILILLWTYYSSAILFFGAEYTKVRKQNEGVPA